MNRLARVALFLVFVGSGAWGSRCWSQSGIVPTIEIHPNRAFVDEDVKIVLRGFPPRQSASVRLRAVDDLARTWESYAEFITDPAGSVDLGAQAPVSGSYERVDGMGLFWSMILPANQMTVPGFAFDSLKPVDYEITAEINGTTVAAAKLRRDFLLPGVTRIPVRDRGLRGTFFRPRGEGAHPAVIVLGGSGGGLQEGRAAFLAAKGYAALALAYFAFEDLPASLENIPLEYFETAIHWLSERSDVTPAQIAVFGVSRGGELALLLGATFREIRAVIGVAPSAVIWMGIRSGDGSGNGSPPAPWTYRGQPLPYMSVGELKPEQERRTAEIWRSTPLAVTPFYLILLENQAAVQKAAIPVERINGPVLLVSGKADQMWPSTILAEMVIKRLNEAKHSFASSHLAYENVGHFLPLPNLPATVNSYFPAASKSEIALGGNAREVAAAATDYWTRAVEFLDRTFSTRGAGK